jgi:pentatricopeptide repeat protein
MMNPKLKCSIGGHTRKSPNQIMDGIMRNASTERAKKVYQMLIEAGITPQRLKFIGYGGDRLNKDINPNHPKQRRLTITISR